MKYLLHGYRNVNVIVELCGSSWTGHTCISYPEKGFIFTYASVPGTSAVQTLRCLLVSQMHGQCLATIPFLSESRTGRLRQLIASLLLCTIKTAL
jgi:hypothetical protein